MNKSLWSVLAVLLFPVFCRGENLERISPDTSLFRRPVAIARLDETTAIVANRCGTLSVIDLPEWKVAAEYSVGGQPTDLAVSRGRVLVTDADGSRLLILEAGREFARVLSETKLPTHPVTVRVSRDGTWCSVASLWARTLSIVTLPREASVSPGIVAIVALPFAPREQIQVEGRSRVIVADSFSGRLAVVNTASRNVEGVHEFGAHNIRGLAINRSGRLLISHQVLNHRAVPRRSDIVWGVMVDNMIREASLEKALRPDPKAMQGNRFISVGYAGQGAGDPDTMFVDDEGRIVIALSGVGEVSIVEEDGNGFRRVAVGRRPVALMPVSGNQFAVVNELSDSLSLIDLTEKPETDEKSRQVGEPVKQPPSRQSVDGDSETKSRYSTGSYGSTYVDSGISVTDLALGPSPEAGPAERGEQLFFDARLSHANWFSCHSCHTDGHSNGGLADTFGDESTGAPKRVLSLLGVGETGPWGWNGQKNSLHAQVQQSAESTMKGAGISNTEAGDLAAYLRTLTPPPRFQKPGSPADVALVTKGRGLFESLDCSACHRGHLFTSDETYDVGIVDERGLSQFNPPSLRGVGHRDSLFHDGRAANVDDVVIQHRHQLKRTLTADEQRALLRYLKSL